MSALTVLGGAAAWPNPDQGCSSYLFEHRGLRILIDCGPDTLLELRKHARLGDIDAVVISHCHADHILDLVPYRYGLVYSPERSDTRIPLWLPPAGYSVLRNLGTALGSLGEIMSDFWEDVFQPQEYDPTDRLEIDGCSIEFTPTQHFTDCYAMRITDDDGASIVYGADTGNIEPLIEFARETDLLISEANADDHGDQPILERGHLTPEDAGEWARRSNAKRLLVTHLWHERPSQVVADRAASRFDGPVEIASRGLKLVV